MPRGVPSAGKRIAQFDKPYVCARCLASGLAATSKRKYCAPCKSHLAKELTEARRRAKAEERGTAAGLVVACKDCSVPIVKTNWRHTTCAKCARSARKKYYRRRYQNAAGVTVPLGAEMHCEGCKTVIVRRGGKQKFCGPCRAENQRRIDRDLYRASRDVPVAIIGAEMACQACGLVIKRDGALQKFCGPCASADRNRRAKLTMARRRQIPMHRLNLNISSSICRSIKVGGKGGRKWQQLVGFTLSDLMQHLEAQFLPGMTFDNHGDWHIDHIRPLCSFQFQTPDDPQFREAWALTNLQPLWAVDNLRKGGRWTA